jgi:hypothetical protein
LNEKQFKYLVVTEQIKVIYRKKLKANEILRIPATILSRLSSRWLFKNIYIKLHRTTALILVLYGNEAWSIIRGNKPGWECSRIYYWERYLGLRLRKKQKTLKYLHGTLVELILIGASKYSGKNCSYATLCTKVPHRLTWTRTRDSTKSKWRKKLQRYNRPFVRCKCVLSL